MSTLESLRKTTFEQNADDSIAGHLLVQWRNTQSKLDDVLGQLHAERKVSAELKEKLDQVPDQAATILKDLKSCEAVLKITLEDKDKLELINARLRKDLASCDAERKNAIEKKNELESIKDKLNLEHNVHLAAEVEATSKLRKEISGLKHEIKRFGDSRGTYDPSKKKPRVVVWAPRTPRIPGQRVWTKERDDVLIQVIKVHRPKLSWRKSCHFDILLLYIYLLFYCTSIGKIASQQIWLEEQKKAGLSPVTNQRGEALRERAKKLGIVSPARLASTDVESGGSEESGDDSDESGDESGDDADDGMDHKHLDKELKEGKSGDRSNRKRKRSLNCVKDIDETDDDETSDYVAKEPPTKKRRTAEKPPSKSSLIRLEE